jgi:hypothetical protein
VSADLHPGHPEALLRPSPLFPPTTGSSGSIAGGMLGGSWKETSWLRTWTDVFQTPSGPNLPGNPALGLDWANHQWCPTLLREECLCVHFSLLGHGAQLYCVQNGSLMPCLTDLVL